MEVFEASLTRPQKGLRWLTVIKIKKKSVCIVCLRHLVIIYLSFITFILLIKLN